MVEAAQTTIHFLYTTCVNQALLYVVYHMKNQIGFNKAFMVCILYFLSPRYCLILMSKTIGYWNRAVGSARVPFSFDVRSMDDHNKNVLWIREKSWPLTLDISKSQI